MKLTISIPKPCHEDWNAMHDRAGGRFCDGCQHTVADLTRATDAQLVSLFTSDAKPKCARFDPSQLDRLLGAAGQQRNSPLPLAAFTSLVAIASGCESIGQVPPLTTVGEVDISRPAPPPPVLKGKPFIATTQLGNGSCMPITGDTSVVIEPMQDGLRTGQMTIDVEGIVEPPGTTTGAPELTPTTSLLVEVCGKLIDNRTGLPIPLAHVRSLDAAARSRTDAEGEFSLMVPLDEATGTVRLEISRAGYVNTTRTFTVVFTGGVPEAAAPLRVMEARASTPIDPKDPLGITGMVRDAGTGLTLRGAIVGIQGSEERVQCDEQGRFGLRVPEAMTDRPLLLEVVSPDGGVMPIAVRAGALPCSIPVRFKAAPQEPVVTPSCHALGEIRLEEDQHRYLMGDVTVVPRESRLQRVVRALRDPVK